MTVSQIIQITLASSAPYLFIGFVATLLTMKREKEKFPNSDITVGDFIFCFCCVGLFWVLVVPGFFFFIYPPDKLEPMTLKIKNKWDQIMEYKLYKA